MTPTLFCADSSHKEGVVYVSYDDALAYCKWLEVDAYAKTMTASGGSGFEEEVYQLCIISKGSS